ncbi:hypothetical protein [Gordonia malaquae]|uniref:hypothetical protein n=1 Tax=Gordonia malaquae TaxID=410332 RepID=UPI003019A0DD
MIDLDPDKPGGPYSYPMEMPVCQQHLTILQDPETDWACHNFTGHGPEVIIGSDLAELDEWHLTRSMKVGSGAISRRQSKHIPRRYEITLDMKLLGTDEKDSVKFHASAEELREMIDMLKKAAHLDD